VFASATSNDPLRKEAYHLKQLQSVSAWRGSLADTVISAFIVPALNRRQRVTEQQVLSYAANLAEKQLEFGKAKKHRLPNVTKSKAGLIYCALYDLEYNAGLCETQLATAREEASLALRNLLGSGILQRAAEKGTYLVAQRSLSFKFADVSVSCTPDLIAFFNDRPPVIIDWKVHSFAYADYRVQLALYALALSRVAPHRDFIRFNKEPQQIGLIEYQLLKNSRRRYTLTQDDLIDTEDFIYHSVLQIQRSMDNVPRKQLQAHQFQTARNPRACQICQYKKICWNSKHGPDECEV
jgi:hypothetical protein